MRKHGIEDLLEEFGAQQTRALRDELSSELHNEGHTLSGNTADSDLEWMACWLHTVNANRIGPNHSPWERLPLQVQDEYRELARLSIECLPFLLDRIANRYITASKAIRLFGRAEPPDRDQVDTARLSAVYPQDTES